MNVFVRSPITTHVLDTSHGRPASGIAVILARQRRGNWEEIGYGVTDDDGRAAELLDAESRLEAGTYRLRFAVASYFTRDERSTFYPEVDIVFRVESPDEHYHVPLLLSPFGYSTYRGS